MARKRWAARGRAGGCGREEHQWSKTELNEGKVVRLYIDNQVVVAMLSHFTSRNPELMRRTRHLWLLLDLNDFELQASVQGGGLFGLLRAIGGVDPPWSLLDEVAHKLREERCTATVVAPYWPGQMRSQQLEALSEEIVILPRRQELFTPATECAAGSKECKTSQPEAPSSSDPPSRRNDGMPAKGMASLHVELRTLRRRRRPCGPGYQLGVWRRCTHTSWICSRPAGRSCCGCALAAGQGRFLAAGILIVQQSIQGELLEAALEAGTLDVGPGQQLGAAGLRHAVPPEGRHFSGHYTRKGACTCARAVGALLEKCCFLGGWSQLSVAIHAYN
ncbi:hypothetical protein CYMTET_55428 [Cymbomonas tetramitiformis]|uniref:Uncharacterized protein n=1 Tax=Cymbomonas tetramitiformis TaxID=36881 RepID=A0AAE0BEU8_9CHLO|nr:hypothetical protein CYMTET_55428 [Cymbomonas tetramitiformis]